MSIDFKHELGQYPLFSPTKTNVVFLAIKSLRKNHEEDVEEIDLHEDEAKAQLRVMKPHELRRMFNTQMYRDFCAALQEQIDKRNIVYNRDNDSIMNH
jgi:hypothetical protein